MRSQQFSVTFDIKLLSIKFNGTVVPFWLFKDASCKKVAFVFWNYLVNAWMCLCLSLVLIEHLNLCRSIEFAKERKRKEVN